MKLKIKKWTENYHKITRYKDMDVVLLAEFKDISYIIISALNNYS